MRTVRRGARAQRQPGNEVAASLASTRPAPHIPSRHRRKGSYAVSRHRARGCGAHPHGQCRAGQDSHGVNLTVARGETVGLVGPSGSGKSSLLMLIGGLEAATAGRVRVLGQDLTAMDEDALARFRARAHGRRLPVLPPDPDDDRARERRHPARDRRRARRASTAPRTSSPRSGSAARLRALSRRSSRAASSSAWRWPAPR